MFTPLSYKAGAGSVTNHVSSLVVIKLRSSNMEATGLELRITDDSLLGGRCSINPLLMLRRPKNISKKEF